MDTGRLGGIRDRIISSGNMKENLKNEKLKENLILSHIIIKPDYREWIFTVVRDEEQYHSMTTPINLQG